MADVIGESLTPEQEIERENYLYPKTNKEALERWDKGDSLFTISMGGMGPGYEQCIHIVAMETIREFDGKMEISSTPGQGTKVKAVFRSSHPDLKPIGEMAATVQALVVGNPEIDFVFEYRKGLEIIRIDTREIK